MTKPLRLTRLEQETGVVKLHSDLYPEGDGFRWTADHPSGWTAEGWAATIDEAQQAAEAAAIRDGRITVELPSIRMIRPVYP